MSSGLKRAGRAIAIGAGAAAVGIGIVGAKAVQAASDIGESVNKTTVIFGDNADSVLDWAKTTGGAFGIARSEALEAAGGFGAMLDVAGLGAKQNAEMSTSLVELAADMASFNNQDPSEMLERLRAGLAGEAEPLRRFGVFLSEAALQEQAVKDGIAGANDELTEAQKVQARYNLILAQTVKQQGDFARTAESLPNQLRILRATTTDALGAIGERLVPIVQDLLPKLVPIFQELLKTAGPAFATIAKALSSGLVPILKAVGPAVTTLGMVFADLARALSPVLAMLGQVFARVLRSLMPALRPLISALGDALLKALRAVAPQLPSLARSIARLVIAITPLIPILADVTAALLTIGTKAFAFVADKATQILVPAIESIVKVVRNVRQFWDRSWENIKRITGDVISFLMARFRDFVAFFIGVARRVVDAAALAFGWVPGVGDKIRAFQEQFHRSTDGILSGLDRQIAKFDAWGNKSRGELQGATVDVQKLKQQIAEFGSIGSLSVKTQFGPLGDGLGIVAGPAGTPTSMFNALAAAVPGPQVISSGYRPGAITSSGNPSLHGIAPPWNAVDIAGANLLQVAQAAAAAYGSQLRELIFTPLGYSIKNGARTSPIAAADHYDHVHLADKGGWFKGPGLLAMGKGEEYFAGGLQKSGTAGPQKVVVELRMKGDLKEFVDVRVYEGNQSENRWARSRTRVG